MHPYYCDEFCIIQNPFEGRQVLRKGHRWVTDFRRVTSRGGEGSKGKVIFFFSPDSDKPWSVCCTISRTEEYLLSVTHFHFVSLLSSLLFTGGFTGLNSLQFSSLTKKALAGVFFFSVPGKFGFFNQRRILFTLIISRRWSYKAAEFHFGAQVFSGAGGVVLLLAPYAHACEVKQRMARLRRTNQHFICASSYLPAHKTC
jgi:hypothetical protein